MSERGRLRVYLGAAPGVGKTYAMLDEGRRRAARGTDVVVAIVETHGRPQTEAMLAGLEVVPRRELSYRGHTFQELDVQAVIARRPRLALVDELAHTNVPGAGNEKRWQDVEQLLDAGIDVITTVNIQHLESVHDVVETITGVPQQETVPDSFVRAADQIELQDMSAEALRRRLAHGNVYAPEKIDAALANYFRPGNLNALRELALLWTADRVDDALRSYRAAHRIDGTWEARERVVVALTGGPEGETLIRRAARIVARSAGADLLAVHVARADGLVGADAPALAAQRQLVESVGGTFHQVWGDRVPEALLTFARAANATQLVLGDSRRRRLTRLIERGVAQQVIRDSGSIDVHVVTHDLAGRGRTLPTGRGSLPRRRRVQGFALAALLPPLVALVLLPLREDLNLVSDMLLFVLTTVVVAMVGGLGPALVTAVVSSILLNYFFTPPFHTFTIAETNNSLALLVFLIVGTLVSSVVDVAARRTREAARAAAEAQTLADLAGQALVGSDPLLALLDRVREAFGVRGVAVLRRSGAGSVTVVCVGEPIVVPGNAETVIQVDAEHDLALAGRVLAAADRRVLHAVAAQVAALLERSALAEQAGAAAELGAATKVRTALLAAVGHDLRTPLAAAKAAISSLRSSGVVLSEEDRRELLAAAEESMDRLTDLVESLVDLSRLQAGALPVRVEPVGVDEVLARSLDDLAVRVRGEQAQAPGVRVENAAGPDAPWPSVEADPVLLERVLVNVVQNALKHAPSEFGVTVTVSTHGREVQLRVIDRGPGIALGDRDQVFQPFQRRGDTDNTAGLGLGLALARGLTEAMGGTLEIEETPGGGTTMVITLATAPGHDHVPGQRERDADEHEMIRP